MLLGAGDLETVRGLQYVRRHVRFTGRNGDLCATSAATASPSLEPTSALLPHPRDRLGLSPVVASGSDPDSGSLGSGPAPAPRSGSDPTPGSDSGAPTPAPTPADPTRLRLRRGPRLSAPGSTSTPASGSEAASESRSESLGVVAAGDLVRLAERIPTERLEAQIGELAAHLTAATCRFLVLIGESDRRRAWASWGMASCAHWLSWHCGLGLGTAREHVRVARAMRDLPQLSAEFAAGRLSYSKMRAVTRIATPALESELLAIALASTASQVDRWVSGYRRAKRQEQTEDRARAKAAQKSPAPNPSGTEDAKSTAEPATAADTASPPAPSAEGPDAPVGPEVPLAGGLEPGDVSAPNPTGGPVSDESLERTSPGDPNQETVSAAEVESWGNESGIDRAELTWYFDEGGDFVMKARLPAEEGQLPARRPRGSTRQPGRSRAAGQRLHSHWRRSFCRSSAASRSSGPRCCCGFR